MQLKFFIIIFCHIYLLNINHHMKSLICTEMQHTQLLLRCECVGTYSMSWVPSSATWDWRSSLMQLDSQEVEYDPIHHLYGGLFMQWF